MIYISIEYRPVATDLIGMRRFEKNDYGILSSSLAGLKYIFIVSFHCVNSGDKITMA